MRRVADEDSTPTKRLIARSADERGKPARSWLAPSWTPALHQSRRCPRHLGVGALAESATLGRLAMWLAAWACTLISAALNSSVRSAIEMPMDEILTLYRFSSTGRAIEMDSCRSMRAMQASNTALPRISNSMPIRAARHISANPRRSVPNCNNALLALSVISGRRRE